MPLRKIAFVLEDFSAGAPGQQLLDRFLIGYARDGEFRRSSHQAIAAWLTSSDKSAVTALSARERDFKLVRPSDLPAAVKDAEAIIAVAAAARVSANEELLTSIFEQASPGTACFVHGALAANLDSARRLVSLAASRRLVLAAGTSVATTFRLPEVEIPADALLAEGLIVVQGPKPLAELSGFDGLSSIVARRRGGEAGIRSVRRLEGRAVWRAGDDAQWSWPLLAAAISRSNTTQGDAVRDGRTQDMAGLGLIRKLARNPRGWLIEHRDGLRSTILVLDGVVADINFAVRSRDGTITSAQLYRPPAPHRAEFDRLAAVLEDFLTTRQAPWSMERTLLLSDFIERIPRA